MSPPSRPVPIFERPGPSLLGGTPRDLLRNLGGPALLRVPGRDRSRARGLSTLLHGNEPSGIRALHGWLSNGAVPEVDLVIFLGAVEAALAGDGFAHRMLPGCRDLNRCFQPPFEGEEGAVAAEALQLLREAGCDALVDLHNNTGHNPAYGVVTVLDAARLNLTALWARRVVHSGLRLATLVEATAGDFPGVALECGRAGDPAADRVARDGLERYAGLAEIERRRVLEPGLEVLEQPIRVCVRPGVRLAFGERAAECADLTLRGDIDRHNFEWLAPGVPVGFVAPGAPWPLSAFGDDGEDVSRELFTLRNGLLEIRRAGVPIMMTTDLAVAKSDCLFYFARPRTL